MVVPVVDSSLWTAPDLREANTALRKTCRQETALTKVIGVRGSNTVGILDRL